MDAALDLLNLPLFTILGEHVTVLEIFGFVTGALCVWAVSRQWIWNWPVGLVNNLAFLLLFFGAGLYADASLQAVFFVLGVYGWIVWARRRRGGGGADALLAPIQRAGRRDVVIALVATALGTVAVAWLLATETDSAVPWPDAFVLSASLVATWLQARKVLEHWWIWIAVDLVSVPLYIVKHLYLTAILYTGFLALCVYGLVGWRRDWRRQQAVAGRSADPAAIPA
ncbi:nicotinamide riboside transporter PnuC [Schumannella luteola]|uniref:Nicotinamide mononucleotide transporter n=1 Tax=Schumannella luteola TaxID=472059 RepID=A0A852YIG6_9MICO|nr:nicotinamide riboside transporter PnuC [Schumannella luteola]NYG99707.1 nicotinamide mononucleotide transporter [Schumannella luteola]TPX06489.1 nicotinamide mononucleotide transporter [Schumannella luteola]